MSNTNQSSESASQAKESRKPRHVVDPVYPVTALPSCYKTIFFSCNLQKDGPHQPLTGPTFWTFQWKFPTWPRLCLDLLLQFNQPMMITVLNMVYRRSKSIVIVQSEAWSGTQSIHNRAISHEFLVQRRLWSLISRFKL